VDTCPKDALEATVEFELAAFDRKNLKTRFRAKLSPEAGSPEPEKPAPAESDKQPPAPGSSGAGEAGGQA
jgi:formate hydrogenlyase subunit 6/NADH:ubiquinone oxidoreductase subunit I